MNILVNASNISLGGGIQVTDYFCKALVKNTKQHNFLFVLNSCLSDTIKEISLYTDIKVYEYNIQNDFSTLFFGRDKFLDYLVEKNNIDFVFTIFGPSRWVPKVKHLCGFAMGQLILRDSPFFTICSFKEKVYWKYVFTLSRRFLFQKCSKIFYSENQYISYNVEKLFKGAKCYTITNYYNPIYDTPNLWQKKTLTKFDGITLLDISSPYPYKNLQISLRVAKILKDKYPNFRFRFVFTVEKEEFLNSEYVRNGLNYAKGKQEKKIFDLDLENFVFLGKVSIKECPSLYEQCDMVFVPTLMECFTALYPESFKMQKPLLTSDLPFAKGLCGKAAMYFSPLDAKDIAEKIYLLAKNTQLQKQLVSEGSKQLTIYDNNDKRVSRAIEIMEQHL